MPPVGSQAGADLAYAFCANGAPGDQVQPERIVLLLQNWNMHDQQATATAMQEVRPWLARLIVVIGPGLGRDEGFGKESPTLNAAEVRSHLRSRRRRPVPRRAGPALVLGRPTAC